MFDNLQVILQFHWPHDRFCLGWEVYRPSEQEASLTINIFLLFLTVNIDLIISNKE